MNLKSLQLKKYRKLHSSFFIEGRINVLEALDSNFVIKTVFVTKEYEDLIKDKCSEDIDIVLINEKELQKIGTYKTNNFGVAILEIPATEINYNKNEWSLALDDINDPGNLGTIIRTADWFGIKNIYCSLDSYSFTNVKGFFN